MLKKLGLTLLFLVMSNANAADVWTGKKKVTGVQVVQQGGFIISFDSEVKPTCSAAGTKSIYFYPGQGGVTVEGVKSLLSIALTAFTANYQLNALYDDATDRCWGQYLIVTKK